MSGMKLRGEKRMRKHLIEQLKTRKILGARIAKGEKSAAELRALNLAPQVFLYKNLFSGQILYSQVPGFHQEQIDSQFQQPNWENRKPSRRGDLWKVMCVANFKSYDDAVAAYKGLVDLRYTRDVVQRKEANTMRKKNEDGNIWFSGQYRPTYSQEAVADLTHVIDEFDLDSKLHWENVWRRGEDSYWRNDLVEHETLPAFTTKYQSVMLDELRKKALVEFQGLESESQQPEISETP